MRLAVRALVCTVFISIGGSSIATSQANDPSPLAEKKPENILLSSAVIAAFITAPLAIIGVIFSGFVSYKVAKITSANALAIDTKKRHTEFALKISELISEPDDYKRRAAMRRFAVGVIKVIHAHKEPGYGEVHFIPMNSRVTVGRDPDNEIILAEDKRILSRHHCGFCSDYSNVYIDDYLSRNGTLVNGKKIKSSVKLNDGDKIIVGSFVLEFSHVRENKILDL